MTGSEAVPRVGVIFRPQLPPDKLRGFVNAAEAAGLDDVWLWEDCFLEGGLTSAAAALAWTTSVRVGLGLMPVPFRNAALAAIEIATLARVFPGRFVPAAGHGVTRWMDQAGVLVESPMTLLREWVTATRGLLHGQTTTAAVATSRQVVVNLPCGAGPDARERLEAELDPARDHRAQCGLRIDVVSPDLAGSGPVRQRFR